MAPQPTSLLSLPNEVLVEIFDHLAVPLEDCDNPVLPLVSVCRRVRAVAKPVLYRDVVLSLDGDATSHIQAAVKENPSLGQLVRGLKVNPNHRFYDSASKQTLDFDNVQTTLRALSRLKVLAILDVPIDDALAMLAALPSPSLHSLSMHLRGTVDLNRWPDLWTSFLRFSGLRVLDCDEWTTSPPRAELPPPVALFARHDSLPQLLELRTSDCTLKEAFASAGPLRQILPNLRELDLRITRSDLMPAICTILADAPSSFTGLYLLDTYGQGTPTRYLSALPAGLRHLGFEVDTFLEDDLLAYLPTSTLESIYFGKYVPVTDRIYRALTGEDRPPQLRQIHLNHVQAATPAEIEDQFNHYGPADVPERAEDLRYEIGPDWPEGSSERDLLVALARAHAVGVEVTGCALDSIDWGTDYDRLLLDYGTQHAQHLYEYDDIIGRLGGEAAVAAWLKEHAPTRPKS